MSTAKAYGGKRGRTTEELGYDPDAWRTPEEIYQELNTEFGFKVDLFASAENAKCEVFFTAENNALEASWHVLPGPGFANPPYSKVEICLEKAYQESLLGFKSVFLVKADTSTKWFRKYWKLASEVRFRERIQFDPPPGYPGKVGSPNMGHVVLVFG